MAQVSPCNKSSSSLGGSVAVGGQMGEEFAQAGSRLQALLLGSGSVHLRAGMHLDVLYSTSAD